MDDLIFCAALLSICGMAYYLYSGSASRKKRPTGVVVAAPVEEDQDMDKPLLKILFGSQTGTAEGFAKILAKEGKKVGFRTKSIDMLDYIPEDLTEETMVAFIVATYGEGEPVDGAREFYEWLSTQNMETADLSNVKFTVFGLGDTQYKHYNQCSKDTQKHMLALNGKCVYEMGMGDADKNLEEDFESWRAGLWPAVAGEFGLAYDPDGADAFSYDCQSRIEYATNTNGDDWIPFPYKPHMAPSPKNPPTLMVGCNRELLKDPTRSTVHMELGFSDIKGLKYEAGDHLAVMAPNADDIVEQYTPYLEGDLDVPFQMYDISNGTKSFPNVATARQGMKWYLDLTYPPKKQVLKVFSTYTQDEGERTQFQALFQSTDEAKAEYKKLVEKLKNTFGFLRKFSSTKIPMDLFMELMPKLQPRYYSIASDCQKHPDSIHICVAVEEGGVATPYLKSQGIGARVPIFVRKSTFHAPRVSTVPMILIGPGTGVAPMIGLLQRREALKAKGQTLGPCYFFFGCRRESEDFLYEEYLKECVDSGIITKLFVAFSRDQDKKVYVQHKLAEVGEEVWGLINAGGKIYVCGDARRMAKDVDATLLQILQQYGDGLSTQQAAEDYIQNLEKRERYLKDVWSSSI